MKINLLLFLLFITTITCAQQPFITTWEVEDSDLDIYIPVSYGENTEYSVDFGDGTILTGQLGPVTHVYAIPGTYTVTLSGTIERIVFSISLEPYKLKTIEQWGDNEWGSMESAFYGCTALEINATDTPNLSQVTHMGAMFAGATSLNQSINNWDVSNVTYMSRLFFGATAFNQPLNNWDVSNVEYMDYMFSGATTFNQPLNDWDISSLYSAQYIFYNASAFNQPLSNWDVSNLNFQNLFIGATAFNQPLNNWNVSNATDLSGMFSEATSFNQPLNNWDVANVEGMSTMFAGASAFNQPLDNWDVSSVISLTQMFKHATSFNQDISNWNVSNVNYSTSMFFGATSFNQPLNDWDVSNVTNMRNMFYMATAFDQPLNNWNVSNVIGMQAMFNTATNFNQNISDWNLNTSVVLGNPNDFYDSFFKNSGLDTNNYDAFLLKLSQSNLQNRMIGGQGLKYCDAVIHNYLTNELFWLILDDGLDESCEGNTISGLLRFDQNANGCEDSDIVVNNFLVKVSGDNLNKTTSTANGGQYSVYVADDTYIAKVLNVPDYFNVSPVEPTIAFVGFGTEENVNFCFTANQEIADLNVTLLPITEARPGFEAKYQLVVQNLGTQTIENVSVNVTFDSAMQTFVNASIEAASTASELIFTLTNLQPFHNGIINFTMSIFEPTIVNDGDVLNFIATVSPATNDYTPNDNAFTFAQVVVNSYDPNDKQVVQGEEIYVEQSGEYLDYIIRFQNTGSASAVNVRVHDILHPNLDWNTFQPTSASHPYKIEITDGNQVDFIFSSINLPNEEADENGSNGYIAYKIKLIENINVGDIITGGAQIFFDYNSPIETNIVTTEIIAALGITKNQQSKVSIYPNPANNLLHLVPSPETAITEVKIFNLQRRELMLFTNQFEDLNVANLASGMYIIIIKTNDGTAKYKFIKS